MPATAGMMGVSGTPEKTLNLDVARRVERLLKEQGAEVVMTRTDDYALCDEDPPIRKKLQDMQRRAAIIVQAGADVVLSIHMNEYAGRRAGRRSSTARNARQAACLQARFRSR